jgi:pimeloyl-ACP methyl ester carboxylesterase
MAPDPRQQFRILFRHFILRLVDLEVLSSGGDAQRLFVNFAALLGAFSLVLAIYIVPQYALSLLAPDQLARAAVGDQEFLIASTMAVVGMFGIIAWDAVFPDRRDGMILSTLPVRTPSVFRAKVSAVAAGLGISIAAINSFTGLTYPVAVTAGGLLGFMRTFAAYWVTMAAAGTFVFCSLLAIQGLAAQVLSYRLFLRVSSFLQTAAFLVVLGIYFVTPGSSEFSVIAPENRSIAGWFPSFWFLGLFQELNGPAHPVFSWLAGRALWSLSIAVAIAVTTYSAAYFRIIRRGIEERDIVPANRKLPSPVRAYIVGKFVPEPVERAVLLFIGRTLTRSSRHRGLLAAYCGIGLAISLAYSKVFLYGGSRVYAPMRRYIAVPHWYEPNVPFMIAGFVMLILAVIGARACFSFPSALKANWMFRITVVHSPRTYFTGVRKAMYCLIVLPIWIAAIAVYLTIWPTTPALGHLIILTLAGIIIIERSLYEFRKMPFACSYLPGKSNLKQRLAIYGILFLFLTDVVTRIEHSALESRSRFVVFTAIVLLIASRSHRRWERFANRRGEQLEFDDHETAEVQPLDLRRDGAWANFAADVEPETPLRVRVRAACMRAAVTTLIVAVIGAGYEQYEQWQHRRNFPQIGHSVNIGGRSLNIFCSGETGPTVVFDSGAGGPGLRWVYVQREVSRFARACWYDRAGYGWSDSGPYPRDSIAIARDLYSLLRAAAIAPPYVLVGASFGGFNVRVFNGLYRGDVAGMVLVDSSHVDESEPIYPPSAARARAELIIAQVLRQVGLLRVFMDRDPGAPPVGMTRAEWAIASSFEPRTLAENAKELFARSALEARAAGGLADRPLVVLTAGRPSRIAENPVQARQFLAEQKHWIEIQKQLARLSTRGKQVVVENSRHCIQCDEPQAVISAVHEVVTAARTSTVPIY